MGGVVQGFSKADFDLSRGRALTDGYTNVQRVASGLTTVVGVAFDGRNRMEVLENTDGRPSPTPGFGDIVRIDPSGKKTVGDLRARWGALRIQSRLRTTAVIAKRTRHGAADHRLPSAGKSRGKRRLSLAGVKQR